MPPQSPQENAPDFDRHKRDQSRVSVRYIHGFHDLFGRKDVKQTDEIEDELHRTIRFGSKLLISGPPGAGKTTFALATVRAMMARCQDLHNQERQTLGEAPRRIAYYISSEIDQEQLTTSFGGFGWFPEHTQNSASGPFRFRLDSTQPDTTNFYAITPMPEVDRPVPSPEELVNGIFNRIARTLHPSESPEEHAIVYIIIDSITALLKGCKDAGDERRQTHEIMRRLQDRFSKDHLALIVLLAEQDHRSQDPGNTSAPVTPTEPSVEDYLADVVFRLYVRNMPLGRRARILEVVKSQGANMTLGEHTWQIVSNENVEEVLRYQAFRDRIRELALLSFRNDLGGSESVAKESTPGPSPTLSPPAKTLESGSTAAKPPASSPAKTRREPGGNASSHDGEKLRWGTIVIFPRPRLNAQRGDQGGENPLWSGTEALGYVKQGSTTLIAGPMGGNKTRLCYDFLKAGDKQGESVKGGPTCFLISFDPSEQQRKGWPKDEPEKPPENKPELLKFTQSQFDLNVLVAHLDFILDSAADHAKPRIAFDGLSEWITTFDKPEAARMLEALMVSVHQSRGTKPQPTVFITYELPLGDDPLGPSALGTNADNILVIRPLAINDIHRKIIYTLKRDRKRGPGGKGVEEEPGQEGQALEDGLEMPPAEIRYEAGQLIVDHHSLDAYTGMLSRDGVVTPAKVLVQLFAENDAEIRLNKHLSKKLNEQFRNRIDLTITSFDLSDIGTTLETALDTANPSESFNLSVHAVDEWWLGSSNIGKFLHNFQKKPARGNTGTRDGDSTPPSYDYWWFELDKAGVKAQENVAEPAPGEATGSATLPETKPQGQPMTGTSEKSPPKADARSACYALPSYMDYGMLCVDPRRFKMPAGTKSPDERKLWMAMLEKIPRTWAALDPAEAKPGPYWFKLDPEKGGHLIDYGLKILGSRGASIDQRPRIFAFDSSTRETCTCMFLELAWAFGAPESLLSKNGHPKDEEGIRAALCFLQFMIMEGVMSSSSTADNRKQPALFSRQWYSTFRQINHLPSAKAGEPPGKLWALPFMPVGGDSWREHLLWLVDDLAVRQWYWWERVRNYAKNDALHQRSAQGEGAAKELLLRCLELVQKDVHGGSHDQQLLAVLNLALHSYSLARDWLLEAASLSVKPREWHPDLEDLLELAAWAALRLQLILFRQPARALARQTRLHLPSLPSRVHKLPQPLATGWVCSGSWMFGVGHKSRSAAIQNQLLRELTSLSTAEERARKGAGLPARKDFFALRGDEPVKDLEYLNWRELLRYGGSRCRRRDRALASRPIDEKGASVVGVPTNPLPVYSIIHQEMLACMRLGELLKPLYAAESKRNEAIAHAQNRAKAAFDQIRTAADLCHEAANPTS